MGDEDESERVTSAACSAVDVGGAGKCGKGGKVFGNLGASDEAVTAKDERGRCWQTRSRQPKQAGVEQDGIGKTAKGDRIGTGTLSGFKRE